MLIYSGVTGDHRAKEGIALMIKNKYVDQIEQYHCASKITVIVKLRLNKTTIIKIIGLNAPENCKPDEEKENFH